MKLGIKMHLFYGIKQKNVNTYLFKDFHNLTVKFSFIALDNLWGTLGTYFRGQLSSFSFSDESIKSKGSIWVVLFTSISTFLSTSLPFHKVMISLTYSCCYGELVLTSCTSLRLNIGWLGNLLFQQSSPRSKLKK